LNYVFNYVLIGIYNLIRYIAFPVDHCSFVCVMLVQALAKNLAISFFEVSAKSAIGVEEAFTAAAREFIRLNGGPEISAKKAPAFIAPRSRGCSLL